MVRPQAGLSPNSTIMPTYTTRLSSGRVPAVVCGWHTRVDHQNERLEQRNHPKHPTFRGLGRIVHWDLSLPKNSRSRCIPGKGRKIRDFARKGSIPDSIASPQAGEFVLIRTIDTTDKEDEPEGVELLEAALQSFFHNSSIPHRRVSL